MGEKTTATMLLDNHQAAVEKGDFLDQVRRSDGQIRDYCFSLNLSGIVADRSTPQDQIYSGLVSLCSTTIQHFMYGVYCGPDAILTAEASSFIALRVGGCAVQALQPKLLKVANGTIQKCEAHGIQIELQEDASDYADEFVGAHVAAKNRRSTEQIKSTPTKNG